jgi:hypothetical protein
LKLEDGVIDYGFEEGFGIRGGAVRDEQFGVVEKQSEGKFLGRFIQGRSLF